MVTATIVDECDRPDQFAEWCLRVGIPIADFLAVYLIEGSTKVGFELLPPLPPPEVDEDENDVPPPSFEERYKQRSVVMADVAESFPLHLFLYSLADTKVDVENGVIVPKR